MNDAPYNSRVGDNRFLAVQDGEVDWAERDVGLPPGLKSKLLHPDPKMLRNVRKIHFPPAPEELFAPTVA